MTLLEAKQALARKLDIDYANIANNGLFTAYDLLAYLQTGGQQAWDRHAWDFKEGAKTATLSGGNITAGYVDYPQDIVRATHLVVEGEEYPPENKLAYRDYLKWKENNPDSNDKYWTEYKRFIFFNMNPLAEGDDFDVYGTLRSPALSSDGDLLPFSPDTDNQEDSGNGAIVDLAYAESLESEKKRNPQGAATIRAKAEAKLDRLWEPTRQAQQQQQPKDRPYFTNVPNFFSKQSSRYNIGNFN